MGLISRVSSRTYRIMEDDDSSEISTYLNFARELVDLIPINVQHNPEHLSSSQQKQSDQPKKLLKRAQKKQKNERARAKQMDGQAIPQQRGNQNKTLAEANPMRIEQKTKEDDANIEFNKFGFITGNEASASGGLVAADADKAKGKTKLSGKVNQDTLRA